MPTKKFSKNIWSALCGQFEKTADGRFVNRKAERLREAKDSFHAKCSEAGRRGNERRWNAEVEKRGNEGPPSDHRVPDGDPIDTRIGFGSRKYRCRLPIADCRLPTTNQKTHTQTASS